MLKEIPGYEGEYAVTDCGKVWSYRCNRWLKTCINKGYYRLNLAKDSKRKMKFVHQLVAKTFIDNPECKEYVDHIDGNRLNNNLSNLRWVTATENQHNQKRAKGYHWHEKAQKWRAQISVNKKQIHIGLYETEAEARVAYLEAKKIHHPSAPTG